MLALLAGALLPVWAGGTVRLRRHRRLRATGALFGASRKSVALLALWLIGSAAHADFPVIASATDGANAAGTSQSIRYPSGVVEGNLLVACVSIDGLIGGEAVRATWPSGWSVITARIDTNQVSQATCAYSVATAPLSGSFTLRLGDGRQIAYRIYRINGYENPSTQAPQGAFAGGGSDSPNPPSLTPTGGPKDYLWLVFAAFRGSGGATVTGWPSATMGTGQANTTNSDIGWGLRELAASSWDPGAFTLSAPRAWTTFTIAVHPGPQGEGTGPGAPGQGDGSVSGSVDCPPHLGPVRVDGDVSIAAPCRLDGTTVSGNVRVFEGGSLTADRAAIRGNLEARGGDFVRLVETKVDGNVRLEELVGDLSRIGLSDIDGNLELRRNRSRLEIEDNRVDGNVRVERNTGGVLIAGNRIGGELVCRNNNPAPAGGNNQVSRRALGQCADLAPEGSIIAPEPDEDEQDAAEPPAADEDEAPGSGSPADPPRIEPEPSGGGAALTPLDALLLLALLSISLTRRSAG